MARIPVARRWRVLVGVAVGASALLMYSAPSGAAPVTIAAKCNAHLVTANADVPVDVNFTVEAQAPATAAPGTPIPVTIPARTTDLPATSTGQTVSQYSNIAITYAVTGGTIQNVASGGDPTINGNPTAGQATATADTLTLSVAGPVPPGTLASPAVTFEVVGAPVGGAVTVVARASATTATVANIGEAQVTCPLNDTVLATTQVVAAGAPIANNDTASTQPGAAVTIDVLANDTAAASLAINPASLAVTTPPTKGTATVTDAKIVYTPSAGTQGTTDTLTYTLCSVDDADPATTPPCDTATVTITVAAAQAVAAAPVTPAATGLPRTGSTTAPLALFGVAFVVTGTIAALFGRSGRRARA